MYFVLFVFLYLICMYLYMYVFECFSVYMRTPTTASEDPRIVDIYVGHEVNVKYLSLLWKDCH